MICKKRYCLFLLLSMIPIFLFFSIYSEVKNRVITQLNIQQRIMAKQAAFSIVKFFGTYHNALNFLSRQKSIVNINNSTSTMMKNFYRTHKKEIFGVTRINKHGIITHSIPYNTVGKNVSKQVHNQQIKKNHKHIISDVFKLVEGIKAVVYAFPVFKNKQYNGCISVIIPMDTLYKKFLQNIKVGDDGYAWMLSEKGIIIYHPLKRLIGRHIDSIIKDFPQLQKIIKKMMRGENGKDTYRFHRSGNLPSEAITKKHVVFHKIQLNNTFWSLAVATPEEQAIEIISNVRNQLLLILILISLILWALVYYYSQSKQAAALKTMNKQLEKAHTIINMSQAVAFLWKNDSGWPVEFVSENVELLLGYNRDNFMNDNIKYYDLIHKEDIERVAHEVDSFSSEKERTNFTHEPYRIITKDGSVKWIDDRTKIIRDKKGLITHYHGTVLDISKRKKAEEALNRLNHELEEKVETRTADLKNSLRQLQQTQEQLIESEKMAALGNLVAGIAHEINTPLGIGVTASSFLKDKTNEISDIYQKGTDNNEIIEKYIRVAHESTEIILSNLQRAADLICSFKQVASDQTSEQIRNFQLKSYLIEILNSLKPVLKKHKHSVKINCDDSIKLKSYPGALSMIITNLIMNSLKHAFENIEAGTINIDVKQNEQQVSIKLSDNGIGMKEEMIHKIFEPFFTTKRDSGGTGLGMYIVYNLVTKNLQGSIICESKPHKGTSFIIQFPVSLS